MAQGHTALDVAVGGSVVCALPCTSAPVCATALKHLCVPLHHSTCVVCVVCVPAVFHRLLAARLRAALTTTASAQSQQQPQEQQ